MKDPFSIVKERYITEKATVLESLHTAKSNPSLSKCENPKYVFVVDLKANKQEIAKAVETIYSAQNIKVVAVNTIHVKAKATNRRRGRPGKTVAFKKAVVTLEPGDLIESV
jgi:large subunit ribosomal protein L23